jgi:hypothetical protein
MKPEYEKPIAIPLGKPVKGSGECKEGSAVMPGSIFCYSGTLPNYGGCSGGATVDGNCRDGSVPAYSCGHGFLG